jgi:DnaJ like chaperone protein
MKADGKILKSELDAVKAFFVRQWGPEYTQDRMNMLREILKQDVPVDAVCQQIRTHMDHSSRLLLLQFLFSIAAADGHVHTSEINILNRIASQMGIRQADLESITAMFVKTAESPYKILEIAEDVTVDDIKKAYRKMAVKYHPDKVAHLGEEYQKGAKEKFQKVNEAYEYLKKERDFV